MNAYAVAAAWLVLGGAAGFGVARANAWLARLEGLAPGGRAWQAWGPVLVGAVTFALFGWRLSGNLPVLGARSLEAAVLVQVIFFDLEHRLVLDRVMFPSWAGALVLSLLVREPSWTWSLIGGAGAGVAFVLIALLGALAFRAEAMGLGDVKLAVFIGLVAGTLTVAALVLSVVLAGLISIFLVVIRVKGMKDTIAYGPYMCAGTLLVLLQHAG